MELEAFDLEAGVPPVHIQPFEPDEYFKTLKSFASDAEIDEVTKARKVLMRQFQQAEAIGQKTYRDLLAYMANVLERELVAISLGYRMTIPRSRVVEFIDKVTPRNSVKACELRKFPRPIPTENAVLIEKAVKSKIFDEIIIVYTDFTDHNPNTPEQQKVIARNRDPIAFGMFKNDKLDVQHERLYVITDWVDDYCHLTFSQLVTQMNKLGIPNETETITAFDEKIIARRIKQVSIDVQTETAPTTWAQPKNPNLFRRLFGRS